MISGFLGGLPVVDISLPLLMLGGVVLALVSNHRFSTSSRQNLPEENTQPLSLFSSISPTITKNTFSQAGLENHSGPGLEKNLEKPAKHNTTKWTARPEPELPRFLAPLTQRQTQISFKIASEHQGNKRDM